MRFSHFLSNQLVLSSQGLQRRWKELADVDVRGAAAKAVSGRGCFSSAPVLTVPEWCVFVTTTLSSLRDLAPGEWVNVASANKTLCVLSEVCCSRAP